MQKPHFLTNALNVPEVDAPTLLNELAILGLKKATKRELFALIARAAKINQSVVSIKYRV